MKLGFVNTEQGVSGIWTEKVDQTMSKSHVTPSVKSESEYQKIYFVSQKSGSIDKNYEKIPSFARVFIYDSLARTSEFTQHRQSTFR